MLINQNISNQTRPCFKAKILFSTSAYERSLKEIATEANQYVGIGVDKYVGYPWSIKDSKMLKKGYSDAAYICTMGFIKPKGSDEGYLFHCIPFSSLNKLNPFEKIKEVLTPVISEFKKLKVGVEGILVGARFGDENSMEQAKSFMKFFDENGISYSAFLGQTNYSRCKTNMFVSAPVDKYIITPKNSYEILDLEKIKKYFDIVKIRPEDTVKFE